MDNFTLLNNKICLCAKTKSGQSLLLRYLLIKDRKKFDKKYLFCPTEKLNNFYEGIIKKENIFEHFSDQWIKLLMKKLTDIRENKKR